MAKGDYAVPREVRALRPEGVDCIVKRISGHYYVYARRKVDDPARPGRTKWVSGGIIGKIEGGRYVPNAPKGDGAADAPREDPEVRDYGAYALLLALTRWVHALLAEVLGWQRGTQVYAQALCWEAEGYVPACRMSDVYGGSVLSSAWPTLPVGENAIGEELEWLGRHRVTCREVEQALIDSGSGTYAIVRHAMPSASRENELAAYGAKHGKVGGEQVNIMGIHDVVRGRPVSAMAYDGSLPDKVTVKEVFEWYRLVLEILHQKGRTFVIPRPPNTVIRKAALLDPAYTGEFTYERNERGRKVEVKVSFLESTVSALEDRWQERLDEAAREEGKRRAGRVRRSAFPDDRVIVLRDEAMHDRLVADYEAQIGKVKGAHGGEAQGAGAHLRRDRAAHQRRGGRQVHLPRLQKKMDHRDPLRPRPRRHGVRRPPRAGLVRRAGGNLRDDGGRARALRARARPAGRKGAGGGFHVGPRLHRESEEAQGRQARGRVLARVVRAEGRHADDVGARRGRGRRPREAPRRHVRGLGGQRRPKIKGLLDLINYTGANAFSPTNGPQFSADRLHVLPRTCSWRSTMPRGASTRIDERLRQAAIQADEGCGPIRRCGLSCINPQETYLHDRSAGACLSQ